MAIPNDAILEWKIMYEVNGQLCMNVLHFSIGSNVPGDQPIPAADGFLTANGVFGNGTVLGEMKRIMSEDVFLKEHTAQWIYPVRYIVRHALLGEQCIGDAGANAQNIAAVITKYGNLGKRSNVGSFHLGGLPDSQFDHGFLNDNTWTKMKVLATAMLVDLSDGGVTGIHYIPSILNKTKVPNTTPPKFVVSGATVFEIAIAQKSLRTMHRRTVQLGV